MLFTYNGLTEAQKEKVTKASAKLAEEGVAWRKFRGGKGRVKAFSGNAAIERELEMRAKETLEGLKAADASKTVGEYVFKKGVPTDVPEDAMEYDKCMALFKHKVFTKGELPKEKPAPKEKAKLSG